MSNVFRGIVLFNLVLVAFLVYQNFSDSDKIAVVRTPEVLSRYNGMLEVEALLKEKENTYLSQLDTLRLLYGKAHEELTANSGQLGKSEKEKLQKLVNKRKEDYLEYQQVIENKYTNDQEKFTEGVLNQVNEYIKNYAEKNELKVVIGSNITGNVLYGHPDIDITEDIISGLNENYN